MSSLHQYPAISAHNEETEPDRISRLHEAFGVMCAIARMVWREETGYGSTEPGLIHTRWDGAVIALRDTSGQLEVIWASGDHRDRFGVLAELAWEAMSEKRTNVVHRLPT
ncbi:hypothetical protein [Microvirga yunnanensis]|uniref:hypothetical protein n=1 Tax=Microvirga yunnanensis TaxID=2953740 RepID=UPI0021C920C6|nr:MULTISPECIES: hypothetical protein [unclassified Microvirga]